MESDNTLRDLLQQTFVINLSPKGKLAFIYTHIIHDSSEMDLIPLEDMALETGIEVSECSNWIQHFKQLGSRV